MSVFIATPVAPYHRYCLPAFVRGVNSLEDVDIEHYIVSEDEKVLDILQGLDFRYPTEICEVDRDVLPMLEGRTERLYGGRGAVEQMNRIVSIRNRLRDQFLEGGHDYFFSLESDILLRSDTLKRLLEMDKDVAIGIYVMPRNPQNTCIFRKLERGGHSSRPPFEADEIGETRRVVGGGMGCTLIKRKVLERVEFRVEEPRRSCDDVWFSFDARDEGFQIWVDPEVRVGHMRGNGLYTGWGEFIETR